jgi:hypothetical protein
VVGVVVATVVVVDVVVVGAVPRVIDATSDHLWAPRRVTARTCTR